jgi:hypothetical protein
MISGSAHLAINHGKTSRVTPFQAVAMAFNICQRLLER